MGSQASKTAQDRIAELILLIHLKTVRKAPWAIWSYNSRTKEAARNKENHFLETRSESSVDKKNQLLHL